MEKASYQKRMDRKRLEEMIEKHGYEDYKWINPKSIVVAQWARMKCMFGCKNYGHCAHAHRMSLPYQSVNPSSMDTKPGSSSTFPHG